mgnify:CR=1 FL=1
MNFNGLKVNEPPCKYCKKEGATDMAKDLTIELHIDTDERCKESIDYFKSIRKTTDYLAFSIKRGIFWHIVLINRRHPTVLFFAWALSKRRVETNYITGVYV